MLSVSDFSCIPQLLSHAHGMILQHTKQTIIMMHSKCDIWSLGVMAYMLLSSQIPFCGQNMKEIARKIMFSDHSFSGRKWAKISKKGREFVSYLMVRDAESRPTADQALKHPWLSGGRKPSLNSKSLHRRHSSESIGGTALASLNLGELQKQPLDSQICTSIENYATYSWMHRLALMVIAYRYTGEETTHLRHIFNSYDVDDSGTVEAEELRTAFALHDKYSDDEIDQIFLAVVRCFTTPIHVCLCPMAKTCRCEQFSYDDCFYISFCCCRT